jgi:hypothetical protein
MAINLPLRSPPGWQLPCQADELAGVHEDDTEAHAYPEHADEEAREQGGHRSSLCINEYYTLLFYYL